MKRILFVAMLALIFCGCKKEQSEQDKLWDYYKSNVQSHISANHSLPYENIQVNINDVIFGKRADCMSDETLSGFVKNLVHNKIDELIDKEHPETFPEKVKDSMVPNAIRMLKVMYEYEAERGSAFVSPYDYKNNVRDRVNYVSVSYRILPGTDWHDAVYIYDAEGKYDELAYYDSYYTDSYMSCMASVQILLEWYAWYKEKQEFGEDYPTTIYRFDKEFQKSSLW